MGDPGLGCFGGLLRGLPPWESMTREGFMLVNQLTEKLIATESPVCLTLLIILLDKYIFVHIQQRFALTVLHNNVFLLYPRARRSCDKVQPELAGWEQLWKTEAEPRPASHPLEFRHLQKCKRTFCQIWLVYEQWRWSKEVSSELPPVWDRFCGWGPGYSWGHRGSYPEGQPYQVSSSFCFLCHGETQVTSLSFHAAYSATLATFTAMHKNPKPTLYIYS